MISSTNAKPRNIIISPTGKEYKKPNKKENIKGFIAGDLTYGAITTSSLMLPGLIAGKQMQKIGTSIEDSNIIKDGLNKALEKAKLDKTVEIIDYADKKDIETIFDFLIDKKNPNSINNKLYKFLRNQSVEYQVAKGRNAFFTEQNKILINTKKLGTAGFHEIGHAMNFNNSSALKAIQKSRKLQTSIPAYLMLIALLKRPKVEGENFKNKYDKGASFIKNHVGALSAIALMPMAGEEILASVKGNKLAKQILSPENYKKVKKSNILGGSTYVGVAIGTGLAAWLGNKVRDKIASPKEI